MLRKILQWILILGLSFGGLYAFEFSRVPCRGALEYAIGSFDPRFGITETEFRAIIAEAERPWEEASGKNLFQYTPGVNFPINLIYDERQERTVEGQKLEAELAGLGASQASIKESYETVAGRLEKARRDYEAMRAALEQRYARYNDRVQDWNEGPRTDEDEIEWLDSEEDKLRRDQNALETKRQSVNTLVAQVNSYARAEEKIVDQYNTQVDTFTAAYGPPEAFDQGEYVGRMINIYQFEDRDHLRMVLAHELGHALGLGHVANPLSLMYPMMEEQEVKDLQLSVQDQTALSATCSVSAMDLLRRDVGKTLRVFFTDEKAEIGKNESAV